MPRKTAFLLASVFIFLLGLFFFSVPKNVLAAPCSFTLSTHQVTPGTGSFTIAVTGESGGEYDIRFQRPGQPLTSSPVLDIDIGGGTTGTLTVSIASESFLSSLGNGSSFSVVIQRDQPRPLQGCTSNDPLILVGTSNRTETCSVATEADGTGQKITVTGTGFRTGIPHTIHFGNKVTSNLDHDSGSNWSKVFTEPSSAFTGLTAGNYTVSIHDTDGAPISCGQVSLNGNTGEGAGENPCGTTCETALGDIPTSVRGLADKILQIGLGLAGGIALILMVIGAIRVLVSGGDQQKLNGGREMLIAAIAGLLFLIFSTLILEFIGLNVLKGVPGIG